MTTKEPISPELSSQPSPAPPHSILPSRPSNTSSRGVYRLAKVDICTVLVHIPMLEGKSSMGNFFSNCSDEILPLNQPFENSYFCIIGQNFKVL